MTGQSTAADAARTPGANRAAPGEHVFELAKLNHILGGPAYSTANGTCVEGDRMMVALMRMPAGTGAEAHSHPNEQWIYILEGTFRARIGDRDVTANAGSVVYIPSNTVHTGSATPDARRRVLHGQGYQPQPARHQGRLSPARKHDQRNNNREKHPCRTVSHSPRLPPASPWRSHLPSRRRRPIRPSPIKIVVPYAPGGATDIVARIIGEEMRSRSGQPVVIESKVGANGIVALEEMLRVKDGYTVMVGNVTTNAITPVIDAKKMRFDYGKEVVAIQRLADIPAVVVVTHDRTSRRIR